MTCRFGGYAWLLCLVWPCHAEVILCHTFGPLTNGINLDGANPSAGLVLSDGLLCGTTLNGGLQASGTAYYLAPDAGGFNAFRAFGNAPDPANPQGEVWFAGSRFFGTSVGGGASSVGAIFAGQTNGSVSVVRSFPAVSPHTATNSGGASPNALLLSASGTIFGTTAPGGAAANGTVFSLSTNGSGFSVLHDFSPLDSVAGTNTDGATPCSGLVLTGDTLYGTTSAGGSGGNGVVFSVKTNGASFTILHSFTAMDSITATNSDGAIPIARLVLSNSTLYGAAIAGGECGSGTIFSLQTNGLGFTLLHHFSAMDAMTRTNTDGASPCGKLALARNVLYGTAPVGGAGASGTVYSIRTDGTQFKTLHSFNPLDPASGTNIDGAFPIGALLVLGNSLYGTTFSGGPGSAGTIFRLPVEGGPAIITNIVLNANRTVSLFFVGAPDSTNIVQATSSLESPGAWQNVSTNVAAAAGVWQFTDSPQTNETRFYRSYAP